MPLQESKEIRGEKVLPEEEVEVLEPDLVPDLPAEEGELGVSVEGGRESARQYDRLYHLSKRRIPLEFLSGELQRTFPMAYPALPP